MCRRLCVALTQGHVGGQVTAPALDGAIPIGCGRRRVTGPNQVWVGDITFLKVGSSWRLAIVMDQYTRRILAWSLTRRRTAAVTSAVLLLAATRRPARGAIFHSDRGSEYMGAACCATIARLGMQQSANASGPGDNANAESFCHSLKAELTRGVLFTTERMLRIALTASMRYYNTNRAGAVIRMSANSLKSRCKMATRFSERHAIRTVALIRAIDADVSAPGFVVAA